MKKTLLLLCILLQVHVYAAIPTAQQNALTSKLDIVNAPSGTYSGSVINSAKSAAQGIFETYKTQSVQTWSAYFQGYFQSRIISSSLYKFLKDNCLTVGSTTKKDRLQWSIFNASALSQSKMIDTVTNWKNAFNDTFRFVDQVLRFNDFIYEISTDSNSLRRYTVQAVRHYDSIILQHQPEFKKYNNITNTQYGYLSHFRDQMWTTLASVSFLDPSLRAYSRNVIGINQSTRPYEKLLFDKYSTVVLENGNFRDKEFKAIYDLFDLFPKNFHKSTSITISEYTGKAYKYGLKTIHGFNVFNTLIGNSAADELDDGNLPNGWDGLLAVLAHEFMHQLDYYVPKFRPYLKAQRENIIQHAGQDRFNYVRVVSDGFYYNAPQEFFAGSSNPYFANTYRCFKDVLKSYKLFGRTLPMDGFLFVANLLSDQKDSTYNLSYGSGPNTKIVASKIGLERNSAGFITKLKFSASEVYEFVLNSDNLVERVIEPHPIQVAGGGSGFRDLDMDNDGILNADEGYQSALMDWGYWGTKSAPTEFQNTQPGALSSDKVRIKLYRAGPSQTLRTQAGGGWASRDPSGDGSQLYFSGYYKSTDYATAVIRFDNAVNDLTFDVTDVDRGNLKSPETLKIVARRNGKDVNLYQENMTNLTPGQAPPSIVDNTLNGLNAGSSNTQRITYHEPVDEIIFLARGTDPTSPVSLSMAVFNFRWSRDTDGDAISDNYDWDSDADGCPDALEGTQNKKHTEIDKFGVFSGSMDANGVPTIVNGGQGAGTAANPNLQSVECQACNPASSYFADLDADGVSNFCDEDNDNDGILDQVENPTPVVFDLGVMNGKSSTTTPQNTYEVLDGSQKVKVSTVLQTKDLNRPNEVKAIASGGPFAPRDPSRDGSLIHFGGPHERRDWSRFAMQFDRPVYHLSFAVSDIDRNSNGTVEIFQVKGSLYGQLMNLNPSNVKLVSGDGAPRQIGNEFYGEANSYNSTIQITFDEPVNRVDFYAYGSDRLETNLNIVLFNPSWDSDLDADQIANSLDKDSDGDGCLDAVEGGANILRSQVNASTGAIISAVNSSGVPILVANGQSINFSQDASNQDQACISGNSNLPTQGIDALLKAYPNPITIGQTLRILNDQINFINIYSLSGQQVFHQEYTDAPSQVEINTDELIPGVYMIQVNGNESLKITIME